MTKHPTPDCPLIADGSTEPRRCGVCAAELSGRRINWCSDTHARWFSENHDWTSARYAAISAATLTLDNGRTMTFCDQCRKVCGLFRGRPWTASRSEAEVNHVLPRWGGGYGKGCWNHQTNLQVLCHGCHLSETAMQKRERMFFAMPDLDVYRPVPGWSAADATAFILTGARPRPAVEQPEEAPVLTLWESAA